MTPIVAARCSHLLPVEVRLARSRLGVEPEHVAGPPVALLVGEAPPRAMGTCLPLFPWPASSSAGRLLKMSGLSAGEYLGLFYRRNLFDVYPGESWPTKRAREAGEATLKWVASVGSLRVLAMGAKVGEALGVSRFFLESPRVVDGVLFSVLAVPHPSGNNRLYNDAGVKRATRGAMLWAAHKL